MDHELLLLLRIFGPGSDRGRSVLFFFFLTLGAPVRVFSHKQAPSRPSHPTFSSVRTTTVPPFFALPLYPSCHLFRNSLDQFFRRSFLGISGVRVFFALRLVLNSDLLLTRVFCQRLTPKVFPVLILYAYCVNDSSFFHPALNLFTKSTLPKFSWTRTFGVRFPPFLLTCGLKFADFLTRFPSGNCNEWVSQVVPYGRRPLTRPDRFRSKSCFEGPRDSSRAQ